MKNYELILIFSPELGEKDVKDESEKLSKLISSNGGEKVSVDAWGKRELAFLVKKFKYGNFVAIRFSSENSGLIDLIRNTLVITECVIRFQVHRIGVPTRKVKAIKNVEPNVVLNPTIQA